jgi:hypothetical protein
MVKARNIASRAEAKLTSEWLRKAISFYRRIGISRIETRKARLSDAVHKRLRGCRKENDDVQGS